MKKLEIIHHKDVGQGTYDQYQLIFKEDDVEIKTEFANTQKEADKIKKDWEKA